ncbi:hypothetical protein QN277_027387 [Acacia crassicarpa]|uniref:Uncharacterized protein n=1 Tax=Acacia crassicarpa TaxID=499986 RepID=A0AAE1JDE4_9FABA|nr:hypothetical protein QN277_027387 [Acacia crassicarpa]
MLSYRLAATGKKALALYDLAISSSSATSGDSWSSFDEVSGLVFEDWGCVSLDRSFYGIVHDQNWLLYDKVTVLESEKRAWENSPEAQAVREALNPWKHLDAEKTKKS